VIDALRRLGSPSTLVLVIVGVALGGLLVGYEPIGGDPDRLYRPLKSELSRALHDGHLPFWSDRLGLGVPLIAESHVAAFYPPNWLLYRVLDVAPAYRLSMWLHYLALAGTMYVYARGLGLFPWGAALAALVFTLCGAQAIHSSHEPLYTALPFLPIALHVSERYLATGRVTALGLLALIWAAQLTVGHFQIQLWTAALVLATALCRLVQRQSSPWRAAATAGALICGAGIAAVQLVLSWDLAQLVGSTRRPPRELFFFWYPVAHWPELAIPRLFHGLKGGPEDPYWFKQGTTGYEACLYVGTVALILAFIGLTDRRHRALDLWRFVVPTSFAIATIPSWWPAGYYAFLQLPGAGAFRAPGRYTILTSLGLALLAGCGFDRAIARRRYWSGIALAATFGAVAVGWALYWAQRPDYRAGASGDDVLRFISLAALSWAASFAVGGVARREDWTGGAPSDGRRRTEPSLLSQHDGLGRVRGLTGSERSVAPSRSRDECGHGGRLRGRSARSRRPFACVSVSRDASAGAEQPARIRPRSASRGGSTSDSNTAALRRDPWRLGSSD